MSKRDDLQRALWDALDPSMEGTTRRNAEKVRAIVAALPAGTFADEVRGPGVVLDMFDSVDPDRYLPEPARLSFEGVPGSGEVFYVPTFSLPDCEPVARAFVAVVPRALHVALGQNARLVWSDYKLDFIVTSITDEPDPLMVALKLEPKP